MNQLRSALFATIGPLPEVQALFALPFMDLVFQSPACAARHHVPKHVQMSTLL